MKKIFLLLFIVSIAASVPVILLSCGSSAGGGAGGGFENESSSPGSVALYVTDSPIDDYKQVTVTINDIRLVHLGSGASCDVLENPVTLDITDLSSVLQLLDVRSCQSINYNRIIIELNKQIVLTDSGNVSDDCNLASYKDENGGTNTLLCGTTCSINMSGAVSVSANKTNELALDFDLKDFDVNNFGLPSCSLTMKVFPLNASDFDKKHDDGFNEGISGLISELDTTGNSFSLTAEGGTFTVNYADGIAAGIDDLLSLASDNSLTVRVESPAIDLSTLTITATALYVNVDGTVSGLDTVATIFTLTYQTSKTILIDYQAEEVEGSLAGNSEVEVKLNSFDGSMYLATEVEVK